MNNSEFPKEIELFGIPYEIEYCESTIDVDLNKRESLLGNIDFRNKKIRIHAKDKCPEAVWYILWHELVHGIIDTLRIKVNSSESDEEDIVDLLALGINSIILRYFEFKGDKNVTQQIKTKKTSKNKTKKKK